MDNELSLKKLSKNVVAANKHFIPSESVDKVFYKGELSSGVFDSCLAVVGSRKATSYGEKICRRLVFEIASAGITIVSGFMYGVDSYAHKAALEAGGRTIAVLGYGIDRNPPNYQKTLYKRILNNGLIISEYGGDESAKRWTFPKRNRIVAALSAGVLVVEASENSGSLITANYANEIKRKIFAVPGPLTSKNSIGTAQLIKSGASVVTCAEDVIEFFSKNANKDYCYGKDNSKYALKGKDSGINKKSFKKASKSQYFSEKVKN